MARLPRVVILCHPHHVTQRGNGRKKVFFYKGDYSLYLDLLTEAAQRADTEIWCYCLMPNHVHLIAVPSHADGLRETFADAHRRYTGFINTRMRITEHLWQGRYGSVVMDETHLEHAVRYVSLNPVRARLVQQAQDQQWSSVSAHLARKDDKLVKVVPVLERYGDFKEFLSATTEDKAAFKPHRQSETTGRSLGLEEWIDKIEKVTSRAI